MKENEKKGDDRKQSDDDYDKNNHNESEDENMYNINNTKENRNKKESYQRENQGNLLEVPSQWNDEADFIFSEIMLLEGLLDNQEDEIDELGDDLIENLHSTKSRKDTLFLLRKSVGKMDRKKNKLETTVNEAEDDEDEMRRMLCQMILDRDETQCLIRNDMYRVSRRIRSLEKDIIKSANQLYKRADALEVMEDLEDLNDLVECLRDDDDSSREKYLRQTDSFYQSDDSYDDVDSYDRLILS